VTFHVLLDDQAQRDFEEIEAYLDTNAPDQTTRFLDDFEATIASIAKHPLLRHEVRPGVRHEALTVFRYHIWYRVLPGIEHAEVFAVLHHSRGPNALEERL
jgi:plasmid stabilization system protein ParE